MNSNRRPSAPFVLSVALVQGLAAAVAAAGDISALDQHFNQPGRDITPWIFVPKDKTHRPFPGGTLALRFPQQVPVSILAAKPLSMLIQCLDDSHVRLGFRARESDPWFLSEIFDARAALGTEIGAFGMHCWSTTTGRMYGAGPGGPMYQKFLVDYVRYRYGLSTPQEKRGPGR